MKDIRDSFLRRASRNPKFRKKLIAELVNLQDQRRKVTENQVKNALKRANRLIRLLESRMMRPSQVAIEAQESLVGLTNLAQRARVIGMYDKVALTKKRLLQLTEAKRSHQGPILRGRKPKFSSIEEYLVRIRDGSYVKKTWLQYGQLMFTVTKNKEEAKRMSKGFAHDVAKDLFGEVVK